MSPYAALARYEAEAAQTERASEGVEQGIVDALMEGKVLRRRWSTISASLLIQYAGGPEMVVSADELAVLVSGSDKGADILDAVHDRIETLCREWLKTNAGQSEVQERVNETIEDRA